MSEIPLLILKTRKFSNNCIRELITMYSHTFHICWSNIMRLSDKRTRSNGN